MQTILGMVIGIAGVLIGGAARRFFDPSRRWIPGALGSWLGPAAVAVFAVALGFEGALRWWLWLGYGLTLGVFYPGSRPLVGGCKR